MFTTNSSAPMSCPRPPTAIAERKSGEPDHGARISAAARMTVVTVTSQYTASASPGR